MVAPTLEAKAEFLYRLRARGIRDLPVLRAMEADLQAAMPSAFIAREFQTVVVGEQDSLDSPAIRSLVAGEPRRRIRVA